MKLKQLLLAEAQDYRQMFNDVRKFAQEHPTKAKYLTELTTSYIEDAVTLAKSQLKRNDRITWYLRYAKVCAWAMALRAVGQNKEQIAKHPYIQQLTAKSQPKNDVITAVDMVENYGVAAGVMSLAQGIGHSLSLGINKIDTYVFGWQWPNDVIVEFHAFEQEWKDRQKARIDFDAEAVEQEVVLDFGNGWMWVNLNVESCRREGDAMGHCGNTAAARDGDRIISLRELVNDKDGKYWVPHLTFILDKDGYLGETKGRNNNKPAAKYHDMIIALLKTKLVVGMKGGGYAPANNFKLSDLTDEQQRDVADHLEHKDESPVVAVYNNGLNAETGPAFAAEVDCLYDEKANELDTGIKVELERHVFEIWPNDYMCVLETLDYDEQAHDLDDLEIEEAFTKTVELTGAKSYADFVSRAATMLDYMDPDAYNTMLSEFDDTLPLFDFNVFNPSVFIQQEAANPDDPAVKAASVLVGKEMLMAQLKKLITHVEGGYTTGSNSYAYRHPDGKCTVYISEYDVGATLESYESVEDLEEHFNPSSFVNYAYNGYDTGFRGDWLVHDDYGITKPESWSYVPDTVDEDEMKPLLKMGLAHILSETGYKAYLESLKPKETTETPDQ